MAPHVTSMGIAVGKTEVWLSERGQRTFRPCRPVMLIPILVLVGPSDFDIWTVYFKNTLTSPTEWKKYCTVHHHHHNIHLAVDRWNTVLLACISMTAGCVADIDVAISIFIIFQRLFYKSLQVVSKVLVLVLLAPVLVNITAVVRGPIRLYVSRLGIAKKNV